MLRNICSAALLAVMLVVLFAGNVQAQTQASDVVNASATVLAQLTITKNTDVSFGNVGATTAGVVYLNPKGLATSNYVGTTATVGTFTIAGANSQSIRLTWPTSITLTHLTDNLTYTLEVNGLNANTQASSGLLTLGGGFVNVATSAGGAYYLWVGGNIGQLSSQNAGGYTGSATFTAEYN